MENIKIKYFKKEKRFGIIDKSTKKTIVEPKYLKIDFFYQNDTLTNLFSVIQKDSDRNFYSYLINNKGERVSNFSSQLILHSEGQFNYRGYKTYGRSYAIDTNCACIPKDYSPCPNRVPINFENSTLTQRNIQKLEWMLEFESMDSTLSLVNNFIIQYPNEPQYYFYKAWLLQFGFETLKWRIDLFGDNYWDNNERKYFKSFPFFIWDFYDHQDSLYISQMFFLEKSIDNIDFSWQEKNRNYADLEINYEKISLLLEKVIELENENNNILVIVNAWKYNLMNQKELKNDFNRKKGENTEKTIKKLSNNEEFPLKTGLIASTFYKYSNFPSSGLKIGLGTSEMKNKIFHNYFVKYQFGYERFLLDNQMQSFSFSLETSLSDLTITSGSSLNSFRKSNKSIKNLNINLLNLSFITKKDGYTAFSFAPELGFHFWNFTINAGYNFVRKAKFPKLNGPFASINLSLFLYKDKYYGYKYNKGTNLFH